MTSLPNQTPGQRFAAFGIARANASLGAEKVTPLLERSAMPRSVENQKATLPVLANANDLRDLIRYLKKFPEGVTIVEALSEVKKRILDPRKISAYESWGVIDRDGDWLKLSDLGWEFSRKLESEAMLFRTILERNEHYRSVLELVNRQQLKMVTHEDIARFWRSRYSDTLDLHQSKTVESNVICFLHLCQAAELGSLTVGKRGQPARMRVDLEELENFVKGQWNKPAVETFVRTELRPIRSTPTNLISLEGARLRVCLSMRPSEKNVSQLQSLLELVGLESELLERGNDATLATSESAFETIRRCDAGLFVVTPDDCQPDENGTLSLKPEVHSEISAAYLFYNRRILLLWDERVTIPNDWQNLVRCTFVGEELTWEVGLRLTKAVQELKR